MEEEKQVLIRSQDVIDIVSQLNTQRLNLITDELRKLNEKLTRKVH